MRLVAPGLCDSAIHRGELAPRRLQWFAASQHLVREAAGQRDAHITLPDGVSSFEASSRRTRVGPRPNIQLPGHEETIGRGDESGWRTVILRPVAWPGCDVA